MNNTILIVLLLLVAAVAVVLFRKRKATSEDGQPANSTSTNPGQSGKEPAAAADDDRAVLQQLREAGSDLSKPHQIEFYLYFTTEEAAGKAAEKLEAEGFEGEMRRAPDLTRWMCLVYQQMVPELSKIAALKRRLGKLAQEFGGEYDGWETNVEK